MIFSTLIYVALGGAVGAALRYAAGLFVGWPWGTLGVNVTGSFAMGALAAGLLLSVKGPHPLAGFLLTGVLGSFTTFSAFSLDTLRLVEAGRIGTAALYVSASLLASVGACALGLWLARGLVT